MKTKKRNKIRKFIIPLVLVIAATASVVWLTHRHKSSTTNQPMPNKVSDGSINYGPPTAEDKQQVSQTKQDLANNDQKTPSPNGQTTNVTPIITEADVQNGQVEAAGYVNIFEDGGTCIYTFTLDNLKVEKHTTGFKNVNTTNCPPVNIAQSEFSKAGEWTLVISYSSQKASGSSAQTKIKI